MARKAGQKGVTLTEMMAAVAVLMILASAAIPLARWDEKRRREARLRISLQTMRAAIDQYNQYMAAGLIQVQDVEQCAFPADLATCYPLTLEELVEGVEVGDPEGIGTQKLRFLQRIPTDPMTGEAEWGIRSYQDAWDSGSWGGENVYDVYSLAVGRALDGSSYEEW